MEKADKTLSKVISNRKAANLPFNSAEHLVFWKKIINVFAFCTVFKISHNDIKPSNILVVKNQVEGKKSGVEGDLNDTYTPKIADFGTSVQTEQDPTANVRLLNADSMFTNNMVAMTPLYASPAVVQNAPHINKFLEDVFSLGMTFLQMAGLFKENQLNSYAINREAPQYHLVSRYINMTESQYCQLDAARAQEARLGKAIEACSSKEYELPYFFCAILKNMLKWDTDERLSSIKLKTIFEDPDHCLIDNLDNVAFVDALIESARK